MGVLAAESDCGALFKHSGYLWLSFAFVFVAYVSYRDALRYIRTVLCLSSSNQHYFQHPNWFNAVAKYLVDAPLFQNHHHYEPRLSRASSTLVLPTRAQALALFIYCAGVVTITLLHIDFAKSEVIRQAMKHTGDMAAINMLPLVLFASRNSFLTSYAGVGFSAWNVLHRWIGRLVIAQAAAHSLGWMLLDRRLKGRASTATANVPEPLLLSGSIVSQPNVNVSTFS
jgi:hypothetical protein